jgi:sulfite dehydrogenase (quinone) subunit SoeC
MNPAYSVILFTVSSGAGYGLLGLLGLTGFNHGQASSLPFAFATAATALVLITVGLLSSTFHLGHPERAWRALSQWRSSWLSREGIAAVATYPISVLFAAVWSGAWDAPVLIKPLGLATLIMCCITVFCTGKIYSTLKTIRSWHTPLTVPVYLAFSLATGAVLLTAISFVFGRTQIFMCVFSALSLTLVLILKLLYWRMDDLAPRDFTMGDATGLGSKVRQWEVPHTATNYIQREMGFVVARKHAQRLRSLFLLWLTAAVVLMFVASMGANWVSLLVMPFAFGAAAVERWLFFAEAQHVVNLYYGADSR